MKKLLMTTIMTVGILGSTHVFSSEITLDSEWNTTKSMIAALEDKSEILEVDPKKILIGKLNHDRSNQALVVMLTKQVALVLMCKDKDERPLVSSFPNNRRRKL